VDNLRNFLLTPTTEVLNFFQISRAGSPAQELQKSPEAAYIGQSSQLFSEADEKTLTKTMIQSIEKWKLTPSSK